MPNRLFCTVIVLFWIAMTAWLVQRDLLPQFGYGGLTYQQVLNRRAIEESVSWEVFLNAEPVGTLQTMVRPLDDGRHELSTSAVVEIPLDELEPVELRFEGEIFVSPLGKLQRFSAELRAPQANWLAWVRGEAADEEGLRLEYGAELDQVLIEPRAATIPLDPEMLVLGVFGPLDELPNLRVGKTWTTRIVNPVPLLLVGGLLGGAPIERIDNEVVGIEPVAWGYRSWPCHVVEHRYKRQVTRTMVRVIDGKVLRQEVRVGGHLLELVARSDERK